MTLKLARITGHIREIDLQKARPQFRLAARPENGDTHDSKRQL